MGYEVLYGRQFVSLDDGTYIPLILSGTNNCTMIRYGREILERYWWVIGQGNCLAKTEEELVQWISSQAERNPSREWFMRNGKWLTAADMVHWMTTGIKSARTIEEIKQSLPSQFLHCSIIVYDESKSHKSVEYRKNENDQFVHTTENLKKWIEEFKKRRKEKGSQERVYPNIEFYGYDPLGLGVKTKSHNEPVICKIGNGYLYSFDANTNRHYYGPDISQAMVFENTRDFEEKTKELQFARYRIIKAKRSKEHT